MKISFSHRITSVVLAMLVMVSTFSFTVESHYCGGRLVDVAVFSKAKSCCGSASNSEMKSPCCKHEIQLVQGQDELNITVSDNLLKGQKIVFTSFLLAYELLFNSLPKQTTPHKAYKPPNLVVDLNVVQQVFLI